MKPLYNSNTGRLKRPRKVSRVLGQPSRELTSELRKMSLFEKKDFAIRASFGLIALGVNLMSV